MINQKARMHAESGLLNIHIESNQSRYFVFIYSTAEACRCEVDIDPRVSNSSFFHLYEKHILFEALNKAFQQNTVHRLRGKRMKLSNMYRIQVPSRCEKWPLSTSAVNLSGRASSPETVDYACRRSIYHWKPAGVEEALLTDYAAADKLFQPDQRPEEIRISLHQFILRQCTSIQPYLASKLKWFSPTIQ